MPEDKLPNPVDAIDQLNVATSQENGASDGQLGGPGGISAQEAIKLLQEAIARGEDPTIGLPPTARSGSSGG